jgi:hypothetical protein
MSATSGSPSPGVVTAEEDHGPGAKGRPPSRARLFGFRAALIFAGLLPLLWGVGSFVDATGGGSHLVHYLIGAGVALAVLWLIPLVAMWRPARLPVALVAYLAFVLASVIAAGLSESNGAVAIVLLVQAGLITLLHPFRGRAFRRPIALSPLLLPMAMLIGAALTRYAVDEAALQATGDPHAVDAHYFDQAWFALAAAAYLLLAGLRDDARRLTGHAGGAAVAALGVVGISLPTGSSSIGTTWGGAALVGGVLTILVVELESRRATRVGTRNAERHERA